MAEILSSEQLFGNGQQSGTLTTDELYTKVGEPQSLLEKANNPVVSWKIPPLTWKNIKGVLTGKGLTEWSYVEPTYTEVAWQAAMVGYPAFQGVMARNTWNKMIGRLYDTEKFRGMIMENMPQIEQVITGAEKSYAGKLPRTFASMPMDEKVATVARQAEKDPNFGDFLINLQKGKIAPGKEPRVNIPQEPPIQKATAPIVSTEELMPGITQKAVPPPIVAPASLETPKTPIVEPVPGIGKQTPKKVEVSKNPKSPIPEELKTPLQAVYDEMSTVLPGGKNTYVTRDEITGEVVHAGSDPSDYSLFAYWPQGWGKKEVDLIGKALKSGKATAKQLEDMQWVASNYKEVMDARAQLEAEGVDKSEIDEAERLGKEEALSDDQANKGAEIISTGDLFPGVEPAKPEFAGKKEIAPQEPISLAPLQTGIEGQEIIPGTEPKFTSEQIGARPIDFEAIYSTPEWITTWKEHPELQDEMLEFHRKQMEQDTGTSYSMEPGQAPPGPIEPATKGKTVQEMIQNKTLSVEQVINELKRAVAIHSKDVAGLQYVLQEQFHDLLPLRQNKQTPQGLAGIGPSGTIANQAYLELNGLGADEPAVTGRPATGYLYNKQMPIDQWLRNNAFAAVTRTIMRFRVATHNPTDAAFVAKYKKIEKILTEKLGRQPNFQEIAAEAKFVPGAKQNLIKTMELRDLINFAEGKTTFDEAFVQMEEQKRHGSRRGRTGKLPEYSISEEDYNSVFNGGMGIEKAGLKPKVIAPVTATGETITFPQTGGRHIAQIYEREIGPELQMSNRFKKWAGAYYGGLGKGSGLIRVKNLENLKTLAHETGHFLDDVLGKYPIDKTLRDELVRVAKFATPFEEKYIVGISEKTGKVTRRQDPYTAYRRSRTELFADYMSVYIQNPAKAKELAPVFTSQIEKEMLKDKEFTYIVNKMREFNEALQPIIDYVKGLDTIPEIKSLLKSWAEKGNLIQNLWRTNIGDKVWNLVSGAVDTLGQRTLIGRILTEKKGLDNLTWEILRQRKHLIDGQTLKVWEELIQPVSKLSEQDQEKINESLQRFDLLATPEEKDALTENIRKELAVWGNEARKLGLLDDMAFWNLVGQYFPWMYETKEFDKNKATFGGWSQKNLRINLQSFKHRLTDEQMGRKVLEMKLGSWPSQKAKIEEYSKEELIALGKKAREEMKLMKTVAYPLQKRLRRLINSVYTAKALNTISNVPGVIGTSGMEGYVKLAEGKSLGNLSGQYVPENLAREINSFNYKAEELEQAMEIATGVWKTAKVPYNPAAIARNAVTNMIQLWMTGDVPTWNPQVVISGLNSFIRRDNTYKILRDKGLYRHTYATEELEKLAFLMETEPETNLGVISKWAASVANSPSEFYGKVEDACKTIGAKYILSKGGSAEQAIQLADKCMFDYSSVSQVTGMLRKWPLPFFTWSAKEFPRLVEAAIRKPEKMLIITLLLLVGTAYARRALGITRDQEESMKPEYLKGKQTLLLPEKDANGKLQWIDFTYFLPWGGWLSPIKGSVGVPQPLQIGNPAMTMYNAYVQNYDPYAGQIAKDWMTEDEKTQARNNYVIQSLAPDLSPWGRSFKNIWTAATGTPEQKNDLGKALLRSTTGISTVTGGEETQIANWEAAQKKAQIEVNRPAKLAWEVYYENPTPENYQKAVTLNKKVAVKDRQRIKIKAKKDIRLKKSKQPNWKGLSGKKKIKFRKYQKTLY